MFFGPGTRLKAAQRQFFHAGMRTRTPAFEGAGVIVSDSTVTPASTGTIDFRVARRGPYSLPSYESGSYFAHTVLAVPLAPRPTEVGSFILGRMRTGTSTSTISIRPYSSSGSSAVKGWLLFVFPPIAAQTITIAEPTSDDTFSHNLDDGQGAQALLATLIKRLPVAKIANTFTPTALGINASAVDTGNDTVTFTAHGRSAGDSVVLTGVVAAGLTTGRPYYIGVVDADNLSFHTTYAGAIAGTGKVDITAATTGWSFRYFSGTGTPGTRGMDFGVALGALPGTTTIGFEFNLLDALDDSDDASFILLPRNLADSGGTVRANVMQSQPSSRTTSVITYNQMFALSSGASPTTLGTWANQSTTAFTIDFTAWGRLAP